MIDSIKEELRLLWGLGWWYLTILFVPILRKTVFNRARNMNEFDKVDGSASIAILFTMISLCVVFTNWQNIKEYYAENKSFVYYYFFCIISILWAGFSSAPLIGYKAVEVLASFLFVILVMSSINKMDERFRFVLSLFSVLNIIFLFSIRQHDNAFPLLGITQLLLVMGSIRYGIFETKEVLHHIIISCATIILGTSSASWLSLIIGLLFFFGTRQKGVNIFLIIFTALFFYVVWNIFEESIFHIIFGNKSAAQISSGTGRQQLWEAYIKGWKESPWLGHGFIVGEKGAIASKYILFATNTAHNMMISVLINTGIIGMVFWLMFLWKQCKTCWVNSLRENPYALICFPAIVAMLVNANSFPVIGSEWSPVSPPIYALIIFIFSFIPSYQKEEENESTIL